MLRVLRIILVINSDK